MILLDEQKIDNSGTITDRRQIHIISRSCLTILASDKHWVDMPGSIAILEDKHKGKKVNYHDKHFKLKH